MQYNQYDMAKVIRIPDTSALTHGYEGKWVALSPNYKKVIASGLSLSGVLKKTTKQDKKVIFRVLPDTGYAPHASR